MPSPSFISDKNILYCIKKCKNDHQYGGALPFVQTLGQEPENLL